MIRKLNAVDRYLKILNGDENITYFHSQHNKENDSVKIVTVYDEGKFYRVKCTIDGDIVINKRFPNIETVTQIISELQPEPYG